MHSSSVTAPNLYASLPPIKRRRLVKALFTRELSWALSPRRFFGGVQQMQKALAQTPGVTEEEASNMHGFVYYGLPQVCIRFDLPAAFPNSRSVYYGCDGEYMGVDLDEQ